MLLVSQSAYKAYICRSISILELSINRIVLESIWNKKGISHVRLKFQLVLRIRNVPKQRCQTSIGIPIKYMHAYYLVLTGTDCSSGSVQKQASSRQSAGRSAAAAAAVRSDTAIRPGRPRNSYVRCSCHSLPPPNCHHPIATTHSHA